MAESYIQYTRQKNGKYVQSGELPKGTRYARVISSGPAFVAIKRVSEWLEVLDKGPLVCEWYRVIPTASPKGAMSDEAKEKLTEINTKKKREKEVRS